MGFRRWHRPGAQRLVRSCGSRTGQRATRGLRLERLESRNLPGFPPGISFDVGSDPESVAAADFNKDGIPGPGGRCVMRRARFHRSGKRFFQGRFEVSSRLGD